LKSKRKGSKKKGSAISGEVQLQFALADPSNPTALPEDIFQRFAAISAMSSEGDNDEDDDFDKLERQEGNDDDEEEDDEENNLETSDETDDPTKPVVVEKEKRKRLLRLKRLKRKTKARAYQFTGGTDVVGIIFLDIGKITDLPPERNRGSD
jgi:phosphatidylserine decarboxylase